MIALRRVLPALTALLFAGLSAQAHELWFEPDGDSLKLYYGELANNLRERSPGVNDRWGQLQALQISTAGEKKTLELTKLADGFDVKAPGGARESLVVQDEYYRIFHEERNGKPVRTRWTPAGRWVPDFAARAPLLKLDVVPTGTVAGNEVEFQVFYQGEPLPEVPVQLHARSGWTRGAVSDDEGKVRFPLPWRDLYIVLVERYVDETPGTRNSAPDPANPLIARPSATARESYDEWSHTTALSFEQRTGLDPLPPPAPRLPASMLAAPARQ